MYSHSKWKESCIYYYKNPFCSGTLNIYQWVTSCKPLRRKWYPGACVGRWTNATLPDLDLCLGKYETFTCLSINECFEVYLRSRCVWLRIHSSTSDTRALNVYERIGHCLFVSFLKTYFLLAPPPAHVIGTSVITRHFLSSTVQMKRTELRQANICSALITHDVHTDQYTPAVEINSSRDITYDETWQIQIRS